MYKLLEEIPDAAPVGYICHGTSGKLIHPDGGSYDPQNNTGVVIHGDTWGPGRLQYRFIPQDSEWGYIEHISSGKIIHPKGMIIAAGIELTCTAHGLK